MDNKIRELARLLCKWNRKEITGDELANALWVLYNDEALEIWNDPLEKLVV